MAVISIDQFAKKTKSTVEESAKAIKIALLGGVIGDTRVDTGRLRGNWQTTTGSPNMKETPREDKGGGATKFEMMENVTPDGVDYMTNNLPYAGTLEERDGMVAKNMARVSQIVRNVASKARRK